MDLLIKIGFGIFLIFAAIGFCYLYKRYRDLRNYTFWVEQSLLQHRPETYIPLWRKQQRKKDVCRKPPACRRSVQTLITDRSKNPTLN